MSNNDIHMKRLQYELAHRPLGLVIVETGLLLLIALAAFLGNSCVLYVFYKTPRLRTVTSYYLVALAISNVAMSVTVMPVTIAAAACGRDVIGRKAGEVIHWIHFELTFSSMAIFMVIAINRYLCVNKPSKYRKYFKPKFAKLTLVLCGLIFAPFVIVAHTEEKPIFKFHSGWLMYMAWSPFENTNIIFNVFIEVIMVLIPAGLSLYCYWKIYRRMTNHVADVAPSLTHGNENVSVINIEEASITRALTALVVGHAAILIPSSTLYHLDFYVDLPRWTGLMYTMIMFMYSVVSPVVYNAFNKTFRREFTKLFVCFRLRQRGIPPAKTITKMTGLNAVNVS